MAYAKVIEWVDIQAPRQEIFSLITDIERRLQLSPLWGLARLEARHGDYPNEGSSYFIRLASVADPTNHPVQETVITTYQPPGKFAYCLDVDQQTSVVWSLQDVRAGTRLTYCEEFLVDDVDTQEFTQSVRQIIQQMLANIRRYAELRQSKPRRLAKWLVDRFYLHLRPDQRQTLTTALFLQAVTLFTFLAAVIGFGLISLLQLLF
jgi:hypothetical protein